MPREISWKDQNLPKLPIDMLIQSEYHFEGGLAKRFCPGEEAVRKTELCIFFPKGTDFTWNRAGNFKSKIAIENNGDFW